MDKYEKLANEIIDRISELIEELYDIKPKCLDINDNIESPALINGIVYYNLEDEIASKIKRLDKQTP